MTCAEINGLLDRLMDDELTDDERLEMEAHGQACPECAEAIRATLQMKALFNELPPEVDVPLAAQAKWRNAVREEAKRARRRRFSRRIGSAAAAVVVLAGVGLALNAGLAPKRDAAQKLEATQFVQEASEAVAAGEANIDAQAETYAAKASANGGDVAVVGTDGEESAMEIQAEAAVAAPLAAPETVEDAGVALEADAPEEDMGDFAEFYDETAPICRATVEQSPACELDLEVADVDVACDVIRDLADDFEGNADVQRLEDGGANVYVQIGAENAADFLGAVLKLDESQSAQALPEVAEEGAVLMLLVIDPAG